MAREAGVAAGTLCATMSRRVIERQLTDVHRRLQRTRGAAGHRGAIRRADDAADDARIRSMVSETPLAEVEHPDARRHVDAMASSRAAVLDPSRKLSGPRTRSSTGSR